MPHRNHPQTAALGVNVTSARRAARRVGRTARSEGRERSPSCAETGPAPSAAPHRRTGSEGVGATTSVQTTCTDRRPSTARAISDPDATENLGQRPGWTLYPPFSLFVRFPESQQDPIPMPGSSVVGATCSSAVLPRKPPKISGIDPGLTLGTGEFCCVRVGRVSLRSGRGFAVLAGAWGLKPGSRGIKPARFCTVEGM